MVGVVAFVSDGGSFVVVHTCLDAAGLRLVPATVIRVNDWTSAEPAEWDGWWPRPVWAGPSGLELERLDRFVGAVLAE